MKKLNFILALLGAFLISSGVIFAGDIDEEENENPYVCAGADASNINKNDWINALKNDDIESAKEDNDGFVTATSVKTFVDDKLTNEFITGKVNKSNLVVTEGLSIENGTGVILGNKDASISLDKTTKDKLAKTDTLGTGTIDDNNTNEYTVTGKTVKNYVEGQNFAKKNELKGAVKVVAGQNVTVDKNETEDSVSYTVNADLSNYSTTKEINSKLDEKADKSNTYTKNEVDEKIGTNLDGEVVEGETRGVTGDKIAKSINKTNKQVINNTENIDYLYKQTQENKEAIHNLNRELRNEISKVGSLSAAMAGLKPLPYDRDYPTQVMAGIGSYQNSQAVAVGVGHNINENVFVHGSVAFTNVRKHNSVMTSAGVTWRIGKTLEK